ncbi:shikimate dehydrogenase [soil metagenome]
MAKSFYTLDDLRHWDAVVDSLTPLARLAVIGDPVAHSKSPQMHNPALLARDIDAQYIRVQIPAGSVKEALQLFAQHGFLGINCTIPHKFEALSVMDSVDDLALKLGAVNTVAIRDGKLFGYNTDGPGFLRSVAEAFGRPVRDLRILIIGAGGGAGQAVAMQCAMEKCPKLVLLNRSLHKIQELEKACLAASPATEVILSEWSGEQLTRLLGEVDLVVNATPIGMKENDAPLFDLSRITRNHLIYDMVYRAAADTSLIVAAKQAGAKTCHGLTLLLHQGALSFGHWFGNPIPLETMRAALFVKD